MKLAGKEHDGSYASGRFCSDHCRRVYCGKKVRHHVCNFNKNNKARRAPYGTWKCRFCELIFESKGKLWKHYHECHQESLYGQHGQGKDAWNKDQTKETNEKICQYGNTSHCRYEKGEITPYWLGKHLSQDTIKKMMNTYSKNVKNMKYRGHYKGIYFEYGFELAFIVYNLEHGIKFRRCTESFEYISSVDGRTHLYFPDFVLEDGTLVEIKGHVTDLALEKFNALKKHGRSAIFLTGENIRPYVDYCKEKYGKDYLQKLKDTE